MVHFPTKWGRGPPPGVPSERDEVTLMAEPTPTRGPPATATPATGKWPTAGHPARKVQKHKAKMALGRRGASGIRTC
jgi:hypothetical protein